MIDQEQLMDLSCLLLQAAETCLSDAGIELPDHRYVTACEPDFTCCSTLAVYNSDVSFREVPGSEGKCFFRRAVQFDVYVGRCVTVFTYDGHLPPEGDCTIRECGTITGDAAVVLADRWVLVNCLQNKLRSLGPGTVWCCNPVEMRSVEPLCSGGCAGSRIRLVLVI